MNTEDQQGHGSADETRRHAGLMTRRERQGALCIGTAAGGAGGYAVFASSNQAGTVVLLLISLVFLLVGVEGAPLLRVRAGVATAEPGRVPRAHAHAVSYEDQVAAMTDERQP